MKKGKKIVLRKIKGNFSGFITISIVVMLGIGFLVGLLQTTPDLQQTINKHYNDFNIFDINLKSNYGFNETEAFNAINELFPGKIKSFDCLEEIDTNITYKEENLTAKFIAYDFNADINRIEIIEGSKPVNKNECLVEKDNIFLKNINIGDFISVDEYEYKVTGKVKNPIYFQDDKIDTTVAPGKLDTIVYVNEDFVEDEIFTDVYIRIEESDTYNSFTDEYSDFIEQYTDIIKDNSGKFINNNFEEVKKQVREEAYNRAYQELVEKYGKERADSMIKTDVVINQIESVINGEINKLEKPILYVLTRNHLKSFSLYKMETNKVDEISGVFPVFFFIVASLITLSTLERMIKEDRISIGTLKSLGYSNRRIISLYVSFTSIAALIGIGLGTVLSFIAIPLLVHKIFSTMFVLPALVFSFNPLIYFITVFALLVAVLFATYITLRLTLREKPCSLLTQKPIVSGKMVFIEKITFIWKRLKFKYKSTFRNLLRFKKNAIMMIVGVAGSTSLVLCGFGIGDSIRAVTKTQFTDILKYNTIIDVKDTTQNPFEGIAGVQDCDLIYKIEAECTDDEDLTFNIIAGDKNVDFNKYVNFINDGNHYTYDDTSIFVSQQLCDFMHLKEGDTLFFTVDNVKYHIAVGTIIENHLGNYIYTSERILKKAMGKSISPTSYIGIINNLENNKEYQESLLSDFLNDSNVKMVEFTYQSKETYDVMLKTLDLVVLVLVIFAGILEITSIYSLTNISISERVRELATLKVLGYNKKEVISYIYRETSIISIIGILIGLLIGFLFHRFVVFTMQFPGMSIGYALSPLSYLYTILIAILFVAFVDVIFVHKFKKISMTESLKSVE